MMTVEEYLRRSADPTWYGEQDENGVDVSRSALVIHQGGLPGRCAGRDCSALRPAVQRDAHGIDLSAIRANLRLTPLQRLQVGDRRTRIAEWMYDCDRRALQSQPSG